MRRGRLGDVCGFRQVSWCVSKTIPDKRSNNWRGVGVLLSAPIAWLKITIHEKFCEREKPERYFVGHHAPSLLTLRTTGHALEVVIDIHFFRVRQLWVFDSEVRFEFCR